MTSTPIAPLNFWPTAVLDAAERKDLVVFVGAGASRNGSNKAGERPQDWNGLITGVATSANASAAETASIQTLLDQKKALEAAELVRNIAKNNGRLVDIRRRLKRLVEGPIRDEFGNSEWHAAILMMNPRIIVTTNYDKIIERTSGAGYVSLRYDSSGLGQSIRDGDPVLIKLHGCVDDLDNVILTRSDYSTMHYRARHALDIVRALLLTRVALFVGYSMGDPDIQLLLEKTVGGQLQTPSHYLLTSDKIEPYEAEMLQNSYGVTPVKYPDGEYATALQHLRELDENNFTT